jgi:glyoxylase-like metal-dependent hydrolase (beta-lactamase superfamily II)
MAKPTTASQRAHPLDGLTVLERGWLSSNNLLIHAAAGEPGAQLVDTGHVNHAPQTAALLAHALAQAGGAPLQRIVNTHLHSDHCGGNATLQQLHGVPVAVPPGQAAAVAAWDDDALSYRATGPRRARFVARQLLQPGEPFVAGGREWQVLAAPGHDPDSVMLFDAANGLLVSADALWENGFGVVFPEISGEPGFDDVGLVLDQIAALPVRLVVPGHGRPFADVADALARARSRLAAFQSNPAKHAKYAVKVLVKYHLMEEGRQRLPELLAWAEQTPLLQGVWQRQRPPGVATPEAWLHNILQELAAAGAVQVSGEWVLDSA